MDIGWKIFLRASPEAKSIGKDVKGLGEALRIVFTFHSPLSPALPSLILSNAPVFHGLVPRS